MAPPARPAVFVIFTYAEPARLVVEALESVYRQVCNQVSEILLWSGNTEDVETRVMATFASASPKLTIVHRMPSGKRSAINECISLIREKGYELAYFMDADCTIAPDSFERINNYWHRGVDLGICASTPAVRSSDKTFIEHCFRALLNLTNRRRFLESKLGELDEYWETFYSIRTELLHKIPRGCINEAQWFGMIANTTGFRIAIVPSAECRIQPVRSLGEFFAYRKRILAGTKRSLGLRGLKLRVAASNLVQYLLRKPSETPVIVFITLVDILVYLTCRASHPELWRPITSTKR